MLQTSLYGRGTVGRENTHLYEQFGECACLYLGWGSCYRGKDCRTNDNREKDVGPLLMFSTIPDQRASKMVSCSVAGF